MFYPYFRGRASELLALRDGVSKLSVKKKVCPIIEPVATTTSGLNRFLNDANTAFPHIVLVNPAVGDLRANHAVVSTLIRPHLGGASLLIPGFLIGSSTTLPQVTAFLNKYRAGATALVFDRPSAAMQGLAAQLQSAQQSPIVAFIDGRVPLSLIQSLAAYRRVLIKDGFNPQERNADYPQVEFFSDLHKTYAASGYSGFGDFLIAGYGYHPGGGPAHAVAIHLSEQTSGNEIHLNHFVSDRTVGPTDTAGKYLEALNKLVTHIGRRRRSWNYSGTCQEFENFHTSRHFPGLPTLKRMSFLHHLELMESLV